MNKEQLVFLEKAKSGFQYDDSSFRIPVTVIMMTYNDSLTITRCLLRLLYQNFIGKIIILDCGSKDGTYELLKTQIKNNIYNPLEIELIKKRMNNKKKLDRKKYARNILCNNVNTKYTMFLSANILLPQSAINMLYKEMEEDKELDMISLKYDIDVYHIQLGATMIKTEISKNINWFMAGDCSCRTLREQLMLRGSKFKNHESMTATHLRNTF